MPENIHPYQFKITRKHREELLGQKGQVIWLSGLSGSGKSTIADVLSAELHKAGKLTFLLDGDVLRSGLNKDLGFEEKHRSENLRRAAEVARILKDSGFLVICTFISPMNNQRDLVKDIIGEKDFVLCYVDCPINICKKRDPKGLYEKAIKGEILNFTGISSPFEIPSNPDIVLNSHEQSAEECSGQISSYLRQRSIL